MDNVDKSVICDILQDEVQSHLRQSYDVDNIEIVEEIIFDIVTDYTDEYFKNITVNEKNEITDMILNKLDLEAIEEEQEDEEYINKNGMYRYLGLDRSDF